VVSANSAISGFTTKHEYRIVGGALTTP